MAKKGNGLDLTNDYLRQLLDLTNKQNEKLDGVTQGLVSVKQEVASVKQEVASVKQEVASVKQELSEHGSRLNNIEIAVRQIASFVGQEFQDLKRRVEVLEQKAA